MADLPENQQPEADDGSVSMNMDGDNASSPQPEMANNAEPATMGSANLDMKQNPEAPAPAEATTDLAAKEAQPVVITGEATPEPIETEPTATNVPVTGTDNSYDLKVADLEVKEDEITDKAQTGGFSKRMWLIIAGVIGAIAVLVFLAFMIFGDTGLFKGALILDDNEVDDYVKLAFVDENGAEVENITVDEGTTSLSVNFELHNFPANTPVPAKIFVTTPECEQAYDIARLSGPVTRSNIPACNIATVPEPRGGVTTDPNGDYVSIQPISFPAANIPPGEYYLVAEVDASSLENDGGTTGEITPPEEQDLIPDSLEVVPQVEEDESPFANPFEIDTGVIEPLVVNLNQTDDDSVCEKDALGMYRLILNTLGLIDELNNTEDSNEREILIAAVNTNLENMVRLGSVNLPASWYLTTENATSLHLIELKDNLGYLQTRLEEQNPDCEQQFEGIRTELSNDSTSTENNVQIKPELQFDLNKEPIEVVPTNLELQDGFLGFLNKWSKANILFAPNTETVTLSYVNEENKTLVKIIKFTIEEVEEPPTEPEEPEEPQEPTEPETVEPSVLLSPLELNETDTNEGRMEPLIVKIHPTKLEYFKFAAADVLEASMFNFTNLPEGMEVSKTVYRKSDTEVRLNLTVTPHTVADNASGLVMSVSQAAFVPVETEQSLNTTVNNLQVQPSITIPNQSIAQIATTVNLSNTEPVTTLPISFKFIDAEEPGGETTPEDPEVNLSLDRDTFTNDQNGPINVSYNVNVDFEDSFGAKVDLCLFASDDDLEEFFQNGNTEGVFCLEEGKEIEFTDNQYTNGELELNGYTENNAELERLSNGNYLVALRVYDILYGQTEIYEDVTSDVAEFTVNFTESEDPQPTVTLDVNPSTITSVGAPSVASYTFDVADEAAREAVIDLYLYKDDPESVIFYVQSGKPLSLDNGTYTTIGDGLNPDSVRLIHGTFTNNPNDSELLANGRYKLRLVVKQIDGVDVDIAPDDHMVVIDFGGTQPPEENTVPPGEENTVNQPGETTVPPGDPVVVTEPPVVPTSQTPTGSNPIDQVVNIPTTTSQPRETRPSAPDAQANLGAGPSVQGNTGPGMLIYPFMAGGSYLLARRRRRQK